MKKKQKILVVVGPTSSGKSALAVLLARRFDGEVISADSRQVYRGLDIGTGKISKREMKGVPHHLLDACSAKQMLNANDYAKRAHAAIEEISKRGKLPIVTGGTGFYIDTLVGRMTLPDVPPDPAFRRIHNNSAAAELFCMLKKIDPARAKAMDTQSERNNKVRLIRALEIAHALGRTPMMEIRSPSFDCLWIGIEPPLKMLEKRITTRLLARMRAGMVAEAKRLHRRGLSYKRMEELGLEYRSLGRLLQGKISRKQMIDELDTAIRHYAKRQRTYWRRNKDIRWFADADSTRISRAVRDWLKR